MSWYSTYRELAEDDEPVVEATVEHDLWLDNDPDGNPIRGTVYYIKLPHQCDEWTIAENQDKAEVLAAARLFAAELAAAIAVMEGLE